MLQRLHDAYHATLTESDQIQISSATTLLVVVGGSAKALQRQVAKAGIELDEEQLAKAMQDAAELAGMVLSDLPLPEDIFKHSRHIEWLGDIAYRTDCKDAVAAPGWSLATAGSLRGNDVKTSSLTEEYTHLMLPAFGVIAVVAALYFGLKKFKSSHTYRVRQLERMPRYPASIRLPVTFTDAEGEMQQTTVTALDVSAGGMKFDWPDAPSSGIVLTVSLPFGERLARVAWSNAFFAGIVFDTHLSKRELDSLPSEKEPVEESKTAPEGAASPA